jgi:hypothetical protein
MYPFIGYPKIPKILGSSPFLNAQHISIYSTLWKEHERTADSLRQFHKRPHVWVKTKNPSVARCIWASVGPFDTT